MLTLRMSTIEAGSDVNTKDKDGETAFSYAASKGRADIVKMLIEAGADVNTKGKDGKTFLSIAILNENLDLMKVLEDNGAE